MHIVNVLMLFVVTSFLLRYQYINYDFISEISHVFSTENINYIYVSYYLQISSFYRRINEGTFYMAFQIPFRSLTSLKRHLLSKSGSGVLKKY